MANAPQDEVSATPAPEQSDAAAALADDRSCVGCGYNLRGLMREGRCPECGLDVATSLRSSALRNTEPAWLAWTGWWIHGLVASSVLYFIGLNLSPREGLFWLSTPSVNSWTWSIWLVPMFVRAPSWAVPTVAPFYVPWALPLCMLALLLRGLSMWALTREPRESLPFSRPWARWALRGVVVVGAMFIAILLLDLVPIRLGGRRDAQNLVLLSLADMALAWLMGQRLRSVARRIPSDLLDRLLRLAQVSSVLAEAAFLIGFGFGWNMPRDYVDLARATALTGLGVQALAGVLGLVTMLMLARGIAAAARDALQGKGS